MRHANEDNASLPCVCSCGVTAPMCRSDTCTSPNGHGGHDCWAAKENDEDYTCSTGTPVLTGDNPIYVGGRWWNKYVCCTFPAPPHPLALPSPPPGVGVSVYIGVGAGVALILLIVIIVLQCRKKKPPPTTPVSAEMESASAMAMPQPQMQIPMGTAVMGTHTVTGGFCATCGGPMAPGAKFCRECGTKAFVPQAAPAQQKLCTSCGTPSTGAAFCAMCGIKAVDEDKELGGGGSWFSGSAGAASSSSTQPRSLNEVADILKRELNLEGNMKDVVQQAAVQLGVNAELPLVEMGRQCLQKLA
jgi:hypothetical protein